MAGTVSRIRVCGDPFPIHARRDAAADIEIGLVPAVLFAAMVMILGVLLRLGAQPVITDIGAGIFILSESRRLVGESRSILLRTTPVRANDGQQPIPRNGRSSINGEVMPALQVLQTCQLPPFKYKSIRATRAWNFRHPWM
jgi:hypothetical protein